MRTAGLFLRFGLGPERFYLGEQKILKEFDPERLHRAIRESNELANGFEKLSRIRVFSLEKIRGLFSVELAPWGKKREVLDELIQQLSAKSKPAGDEKNIVITGSPLMHGDKFIRLLDSLDVPLRITFRMGLPFYHKRDLYSRNST